MSFTRKVGFYFLMATQLQMALLRIIPIRYVDGKLATPERKVSPIQTYQQPKK